MHEKEFLIHLGIALTAALMGGIVARALRLPVLVGYLLAGVTVGPHTPGFIADEKTVQPVAHLGVALLMFAVGVQFSLKELGAVRRMALLGGSAQILATILLGFAVGVAAGWGLYGGLFLGCALSLSSTAVMMRTLEERGELGTTHGSLMLGILVVQDLSVVLMVALLPALAALSGQGMGALAEVGSALLRAALFIGATLLLATRGAPALLHRVARLGSHELFLLTVVCLCLAAAAVADRAGLGLELGAFLAGLVVSESPYAHEVFTQVKPLRDVFASIFFVSVGMLLNPAFVLQNWPVVLAVVFAIIVGKSLLTALPVYALGAHGRTAVLTGLGLAQIGEFSFILALIGSQRGLIDPQISGVILSSALITILLTPFLYGSADSLYQRLNVRPALSRRLNRQGRIESSTPQDMEATFPRVIVLGCGRVGGYVSEALRAKRVPHVVVDYDAATIERLRAEGVSVVYGDASSPTVLAQAAPHHAELAVVALPEAASTEMAIRALKQLAPNLPIVARVHRGIDIPRMRAAGAEAVIHAEFEAGTEMIRQGLDRLGFPDPEVDIYIESVRQQRYREAAA